jgi:hypothetical protein
VKRSDVLKHFTEPTNGRGDSKGRILSNSGAGGVTTVETCVGAAAYCGENDVHLGRMNALYHEARRRVATAIDSNSPKAYRREE